MSLYSYILFHLIKHGLLQVLVTIRIEDVNDSPPAFESDKLVFYVAENSPIGSLAGVLYAKDPDEGPNAIVQYSIIGNYKSLRAEVISEAF